MEIKIDILVVGMSVILLLAILLFIGSMIAVGIQHGEKNACNMICDEEGEGEGKRMDSIVDVGTGYPVGLKSCYCSDGENATKMWGE